MKLFGNKDTKKVRTIDMVMDKNTKDYLGYLKDIYSISGLKFTEEDKESSKDDFVRAVDYFKGYMESTFSDEVLLNGNDISINEEDMLRKADGSSRNLFVKPLYRDIIYLCDSVSFSHIHTNGSNVVEAEGIKAMRGLKRELLDVDIDSMFKGLTVVQAAALLTQMGLLETESELNREISRVRFCEQMRKILFNSIVYSILDSDSELRVNRARLFADTFGANFSFGQVEREIDEQKKLKKDM